MTSQVPSLSELAWNVVFDQSSCNKFASTSTKKPSEVLSCDQISAAFENASTYSSKRYLNNYAFQALYHPDLAEITLKDWLVDFNALKNVKSDRLTTLHLVRCDYVQNKAIETLVAQNPKVRDFSLSECRGLNFGKTEGFPPSTFKALAGWEYLDTLDLSYLESLTEEALEQLLAGLPNLDGVTRIYTLNLSACPQLKEQSWISLATHCPNVLNLRLANSRLDNTGLARICDSCQRLTTLDIGSTQVSSYGDLSKLTDLQQLNLEKAYCLAKLEPLAALKELRSLNLSDCYLVRDLSPLLACDKLETLILTGCTNISEAAIQQFQELLPKVTIIR